MHIPMESLSLLTTRTDSGSEGVASRSISYKEGLRFDKIFEQEISKHDRKMQEKPKGYADNPKSAVRAKGAASSKKNAIYGEGGEALAAGVMGEKDDEVVFVLEGDDEESVATPQMCVDCDVQAIFEAGTDSGIGTKIVIEDSKYALKQDDIHTRDFVEAGLKDALDAKTEAATEITYADADGEVTARTPSINREDGTQGEQESDIFKDNGSPSLLENENETEATGHKELNYIKAVEAAKHAVVNKVGEEEDCDTTASDIDATVAAPLPLSGGIRPEQFKAVQQLTQEAVAHAVKPENLFEEMISKVQTAQDASKSTMTIQLNPEYLGRVALQVSVDAAGCHVKISAEDSSVRGMINSQLTTLISSLEEKGIAVSEVEVVFAGASFDSTPDSREQGQGSSADGKSGSQGSQAKESVEYYTTLTELMDYYLDSGISSGVWRA